MEREREREAEFYHILQTQRLEGGGLRSVGKGVFHWSRASERLTELTPPLTV